MASLTTRAWLREHLNCLTCGPTGIGKGWLRCALVQKACRDGFSALVCVRTSVLPGPGHRQGRWELSQADGLRFALDGRQC